MKCQYATVHSLGYNQEKLEIFVLFRAVISFEVMGIVAMGHTTSMLLWVDSGC